MRIFRYLLSEHEFYIYPDGNNYDKYSVNHGVRGSVCEWQDLSNSEELE